MSSSTPRWLAALFLVAVVALHATLFWIGHHPQPRPLTGDEPMYWNGANQLAAGETWTYESLWPPLQPVVLAAILLAGGGSMLAIEIVQTAMLVAAAFLLADITRELSGSRLAALVAGGLVVGYPPLAGFAHFLWPEVTHLTFFVGALWILVRRGRSRVWVLAAGLLFGLALTSKYLVWPFLFLALPVVVLVPRLRPRADRLALFLAGLVLVVSLVYSSDRLQVRGYPVVESATFNACVGLHERSRKDFLDPVVGIWYRQYIGIPSIPERDEFMWTKISDLVRERGVGRVLLSQISRQYFRIFDKDSFLTDQLPGGALAVGKRGYRETPAAVAFSLRAWSYSFYALILVGTVVGIAVAPARGRRWSRFFLAFLGYAMLVFLISHVKSRFRAQLLPFSFIYTGYAVAWLSVRLGWSPGEAELWTLQPERRRWIAASVATALLLFLAFGRRLV